MTPLAGAYRGSIEDVLALGGDESDLELLTTTQGASPISRSSVHSCRVDDGECRVVMRSRVCRSRAGSKGCQRGKGTLALPLASAVLRTDWLYVDTRSFSETSVHL